ncbi:MAG: hypothetical protein GWO20_08785 [Candidatus Korarchaeota archaeon]|nr:hypothetical protein [Candidatus Korarchaeota archaeon]NIU83518.1 hypothetical protein [Candidatus Thorarchaeota archaeon]NIW13783.1 hypothetical protein [Candidatus Thorarchaeota archaeon]NIW51911.1 hypothetical protein [Candidatus Korarchaeota archaeon]
MKKISPKKLEKQGITKTTYAFILVLSLSMAVTPALLTSIPSPLTVKLDRSQEVELTSSIIRARTNSLMVTYGSPRYYLLSWRTYGPTIWVGHGSKQGISVQGKQRRWKTFAGKLSQTPGRDLVASCFANQIAKYESNAIPLGSGPTDARVSGFLAVYAITGDTAYLR